MIDGLGSAGVGGLGAVAAIVLREWWADRKQSRAVDAEADARKDATGLLKDTIELLRQDLKDREDADKETLSVLTRFAVSIESLVQSSRATNIKIEKLHDRMTNGGHLGAPDA